MMPNHFSVAIKQLRLVPIGYAYQRGLRWRLRKFQTNLKPNICGSCMPTGCTLLLASTTASISKSSLDGKNSGSPKSDDIGFGHPSRRATDCLIAINVLMAGLQLLSKGAVTNWGIKDNEKLVAGELWRFITAGFLHDGPLHLFCNMFAIHTMGPNLEQHIGAQSMVAMYLTTGLCGELLSAAFCPGPSLGASGSVFGIAGAMAVFFLRNGQHLSNKEKVKEDLEYTCSLILVNLLVVPLIFRNVVNIDNWGHVGGLLGGALFGTRLNLQSLSTGEEHA